MPADHSRFLHWGEGMTAYDIPFQFRVIIFRQKPSKPFINPVRSGDIGSVSSVERGKRPPLCRHFGHEDRRFPSTLKNFYGGWNQNTQSKGLYLLLGRCKKRIPWGFFLWPCFRMTEIYCGWYNFRRGSEKGFAETVSVMGLLRRAGE